MLKVNKSEERKEDRRLLKVPWQNFLFPRELRDIHTHTGGSLYIGGKMFDVFSDTFCTKIELVQIECKYGIWIQLN